MYHKKFQSNLCNSLFVKIFFKFLSRIVEDYKSIYIYSKRCTLFLEIYIARNILRKNNATSQLLY